MQFESKSLAFTMPRGADMYSGHVSMYPFPALWQATTATEGLLQCLNPHESLLVYMDTFAEKAVGFAFPFLPEELSRKEVENFLQDANQNAVMYPDALALILAGAALGIQLGGESENAEGREDRARRGDVFSKSSDSSSPSCQVTHPCSCRRDAGASCFWIHEPSDLAVFAGPADHKPLSHQ